MKSIKVKILGPVAVLAVLVLVTSAFSILGAGNIEKKGRVVSDQYLATIQDVSAMSKNTQTLMRLSYNYILEQSDAAEKKRWRLPSARLSRHWKIRWQIFQII